MPKKKRGIREVLALNLKLNRQKCGLTQEKLAEKAGINAVKETFEKTITRYEHKPK